MAFMIGPLEETSAWNKKKEKVDILFLLRGDQESKYPESRDQANIRNILEEDPLSAQLSFDVADWWDNKKYLDLALKDPPGPQLEHKVLNEGKFDYMAMFRKSIAMFSSSRVVITDRLHASILAFLLHKPHVYLDQSYGKIRLTREVAFNTSTFCQDRGRLRFDQAEDIRQAVSLAGEMVKITETTKEMSFSSVE